METDNLKGYEIRWPVPGKTQQTFLLNGTEENFHKFISQYLQTAQPTRKVNFKFPNDESDEEFQASEDFFFFRNQNSIPANETTVTCKDGNIKANVLLLWARDYLNLFMEKTLADEMDTPCGYFVSNAGKFAKMKTSIEGKCAFQPGDYEFGRSEVKVKLTDDERLEIVDTELKNWIQDELKLNITKWDLPYRGYDGKNGYVFGIDNIIDKIVTWIDFSSHKFEDTTRTIVSEDYNFLSLLQKYCMFPREYPIGDETFKLLEQGELWKFLDYFNGIIFGVEASRNILVFFTGLICLQDIKHREGYDDLFDLFPLAVTGTGPGNFIMEKALYLSTKAATENQKLLEEQQMKAVGFGFFRHNISWLKVTVKSASVIYNWAKNLCLLENASEIKSEQFNEEFSERFFEELEHYLK